MGVKFGEIDVSQIIDNEFRIGVLEKIIEFLISKNTMLIKPDLDDIKNIKKEVVKGLQEKYPKSGIGFKEN